MEILPRMVLKPPTGFIYDKRSERWELLEEGPKVEGEPILDFLGFLREGEDYVNGHAVLARSLEMSGSESGQHHLERMLQQDVNIPLELRSYYLVATGTRWRRPGGKVCLAYLNFFGGKWVLRFGQVVGHWGGRDRVVRVCK